MADIISYGAYLPRPRAPLGEIQSFFGRPGRPRSKALATPALDEDTLTMAYEAGVRALDGATRAPASLITVTQAPPFGLRKLSSTLARALGIPEARPLDVGGNPAALLDAFEIAGALSEGDGGPALVVASDHLISHEDRVCDILSAGGAAAFLVGADGFATLGATARASQEVYDVWRLGTEAEARYRLEVLFDAYAATTKKALAALQEATERPIGDYAAVAASQPHPQTLRGLGKAGVSAEQLANTSFVGEIGNLGSASVGVALAMGLDAAASGDRLIALGYGGGEAIAQEIEVTAAVPSTATAEAIPGEAISVSTYYRWTRGRQAEPH